MTTPNSSQVQLGLRIGRVDGREVNLLACLMHLIVGGDLYEALNLVSRGDNIKRLGYTLARVFHYQECLPAEELKIKGYDLLRQLVTNIVSGLWDSDANLNQRRDYQKVVNALFTKHGLKAP